jgi:hypothetical protein
MIAEKMQRGPNQSIYFTEISAHNHYQIVSLTFVKKAELKRTVLYKLMEKKIVQF